MKNPPAVILLQPGQPRHRRRTCLHKKMREKRAEKSFSKVSHNSLSERWVRQASAFIRDGFLFTLFFVRQFSAGNCSETFLSHLRSVVLRIFTTFSPRKVRRGAGMSSSGVEILVLKFERSNFTCVHLWRILTRLYVCVKVTQKKVNFCQKIKCSSA